MPEDPPITLGLQAGDTPEMAIGLDTTRFWANGVQVTLAGTDAFLVFREQIAIQSEPGGPGKLVIKNVTSVVLPIPAAIQMAQIIRKLTSPPPEEDGGNAAA